MAKERQTNIELCRLASILLVMLVHTTSQSLGTDMNFGARLLEAFSIIGVNVFILITGYFSASPKKTNLVNLAFICLFWMFVKVALRYTLGKPLGIRYVFFITSSNWFIPSYIGLLFLTPTLNAFCNTVSKRELWSVVITLFLIEMWFDWLPPYPAVMIGTQKGYSVFSFAILYLLARAIKLYGLPNWFERWSFVIYLACSSVLAIIAQALVWLGYANKNNLWFAYTNPIIIISSVAFLMMFMRMSIQSKVINHIAKSTLAVLLGHSAIFFLYTKQFKYLYDKFSGLQIVAYWVLAIAVVFWASIAIDQIRLLLYKPIENLMKARIKNNNIFGTNKRK